MRQLVCDIEHYPNFVPGCVATERLTSSGDEWDASVDLSVRGVGYRLATRNKQTDSTLTMSLLSGPFHSLEGIWSFRPLSGGGCEVALRLDVRAKGFAIRSLLRLFGDSAAERVVQAFIDEAERRYAGV